MKYNLDLGIKSAVQDWMNNKYENWVKNPVEQRTLELENFISQQLQQAQTKANQYNPVNKYTKQPTFYRGLFWIAVALLIVLWLIADKLKKDMTKELIIIILIIVIIYLYYQQN